MITIKEMANMLGVSTTTVSNVIHGKTKEVSPDTVERVQKIIEEYEYVPNINARNLANNQSKIIGVAMLNNKMGMENYLKDAFMGELLGSIERELKSSGYYLMMCFSSDVKELIQTVSSWNVDGLILFGIRSDDYNEIQKKFKKPQIFIDCYINNIPHEGVNIGIDDRRGGFLVGKYLLSKGHTNIGYLSDNFIGSDYERYCGLASAMSDAGVSFGRGNCIEVHPSNEDEDACYQKVLDCVDQFSAIFCASDYYALNVLNYLRKNGVRVPEDISLVGFDDNIYAKMCYPALTTIHQNPTEKGRLAVRYLIKQLEEKKIDNDWIVLPVSLVERDTVREIAQDK